jgi:hypothetical protein
MRAVIVALTLALPALAVAADVHFTWTAPTDPPLGYVVERKSGLAGPYGSVGYPSGTTWTETDLPASSSLPVCYQVRAVNERGLSAPSNEVCLSLPQAPVNLKVETVGPSATAPRVSVGVKVRKKP